MYGIASVWWAVTLKVNGRVFSTSLNLRVGSEISIDSPLHFNNSLRSRIMIVIVYIHHRPGLPGTLRRPPS